MAGKSKQLSNPFSTGGGGPHFESHVQAAFVVLMLSQGYAPWLPSWPIVEIKLQGKVAGYDTDDFIVFVENPQSKARRKLLGQIKHTIAITTGSKQFGEVMQAAWNDYSSHVFKNKQDKIALITGPISATDFQGIDWLLGQARHSKDAREFFYNVQQAKFSSQTKKDKLQVLQDHLVRCNNDQHISDEQFHDFLKHFHLLGYDLGTEGGVVLSLLHSHVAQFHNERPAWLWSRIVDIVQTWNQDAGTITRENLPEDILDEFKERRVVSMPARFAQEQDIEWDKHANAHHLAMMALFGSWNEDSERDKAVISQQLCVGYDKCLEIAREFLTVPNAPLSLKNGIWRVNNRSELLLALAPKLLDQDFDRFKEIALTVLKEQDPAFDLDPDERFGAAIYGKKLNYSEQLRNGIAEGLAIIASNADAYTHASQQKAEFTSLLVVRELLENANWVTWGSLNDVLPALAEAAPRELLESIEKALEQEQNPFAELYAQERAGITGRNYMTGLLWALECLAWDEQWLVRVCVVLGELATFDPGGNWANRPINSIVTILLPWLPQTMGDVKKREVAANTLYRECPDIAWDALLKLLPDTYSSSSGRYKPKWRQHISSDWEKGVSTEEYWQQVSAYANLLLEAAENNIARLVQLVESLDKLPASAFNSFLELVSSPSITSLPESEYAPLWRSLTAFTQKHKRFHEAKWALPEEAVKQIEAVTKQLAPSDLFDKYQILFGDRDWDLFDDKRDYKAQQLKLDEQRVTALRNIYEEYDIAGILKFVQSVVSQRQLGYALGAMGDDTIDSALLPSLLDSEDRKLKQVVSAYVSHRHRVVGWEWCDSLDKTSWVAHQTASFLSSLSFSPETWTRVPIWLGDQESIYWSQVVVHYHEGKSEIHYAVKKLLEYGRPIAALDCISFILSDDAANMPFDLCIKALFAAANSKEQQSSLDGYHISSLITFLQNSKKIDDDILSKIEWIYLALLDNHSEGKPKVLMRKLANEPEFFCELIQKIYRPKNEKKTKKEPTAAEKNVAQMAWHLLHVWKIPPGLQEDNSFDGEHFRSWLLQVKEICTKSGHIDIALSKVGEVLRYAPKDPNGLWIHSAVAEVLNEKHADILRDGFRSALYNARGVCTVDPSCTPERDLAEAYAKKAELVENQGFHRLADTLRTLASSYENEAKRIIARFGEED